MSIFRVTNGLYAAHYDGGPLNGETELRATAGDQPAGRLGVLAPRGTAWYHHVGGHGLPGRVTFDYAYDYTVLD